MKKIKNFSLGLIAGVVLTSSTVVGATTYLKATPKTIKIVVGNSQQSVSAMNVNNKFYIPVREAANSFGYQVKDATSSVVTFQEGVVIPSGNTTTNSNSTKVSGVYVENLRDKYSSDGKLDASKVKKALESGEINVNVQDKVSKTSLLQFVIEEENFAVYQLLKTSALDVNLIDAKGQTALFTSVLANNNFYYGELTNHFKADPNIKDKNGKTILDLIGEDSSLYISLKTYTWAKS